MLTKIRSGVDNIVVRIILGLVALSFVGFGGVSFMSGNSRGDAVSFSNIDSISMEEFLRAKHQKIESIQNQNGINLSEEQIEELNIDRAVLQDLISRAMINNIASLYEFDVSDEQVIAFAKRSPMFRNENGEFDPEIYKSIFRDSKKREEEYLGFIRNQLVHGTIAGLFSVSFQVPKIMSDNIVDYMSETKSVDIYKMDLSFKDKEFKSDVPETSLLREIYDTNAPAFTVPEKRSFRFIKASEKFLAKKLVISEEEMKSFFEENPEEFEAESYIKAKKDVKYMLTQAKLDELSAELSRNLEDDVAAGMTIEEIANKYTFQVNEVKDMSKLDLINNKNEDYIELADQVFEMIDNEISYPIEIKEKHEILLTVLDTITPARNQEFEEVEGKILELWQKNKLEEFNINKFAKFAEENKGGGNANTLNKKGIELIKKTALSRLDMHQEDLPIELLGQIFQIADGNKTQLLQGDGVSYFAYLNKSFIDSKKQKEVEKQGLEHFQNTIKESILQEMITNMTLKNDVKINLK